MLVLYGRFFGRRKYRRTNCRTTFSSGWPLRSYIARKKNGSMVSTITRAAVLVPRLPRRKKNSGTPMSAPLPKQISCRFVRLKATFVFTFVRSLGTET